MNNEDKLFELMEKMYGELQETRSEVKEVKNEVKEVKSEMKEVKGRVINIENNHGKKLAALFDGYTQLNEKVDRIENQVSKQEEIIIRKVK